MTKIGNLEVHPDAELFPMMQGEAFAALKADIRENGQLEPVVLDEQGRILDGRNRARAIEELRAQAVAERWAASDMPTLRTIAWDQLEQAPSTPLGYVLAMNLTRRHLDENALGWLLTQPRVKAHFDELARARLEDGRRRGGKASRGRRLEHQRTDAPDPEAGWAGLAAAAGKGKSSRRTVQYAAAFRRAADEGVLVEQSKGAAPARLLLPADARERARELARAADAGSPPKFSRAMKELKLAALSEKVRTFLPPEGRFGVIVADPPWRYDTRTEDPTHRGRVGYPTLSVEDVCRARIGERECMDVGRGCIEFADDDCVLFLWVTNAFLSDGSGARVASAWGFEAKTIWTWVKRTDEGAARPGVGNWGRNVTEHAIVAVRGRPVVNFAPATTLIEATRREHSRKPDEFFELVERCCKSPARVDLYARETRPGWVSTGAEVDKFTRTPSSVQEG